MLRGVKWLLEYVLSVMKVSVIFLCALFLPRFFIHYVSNVESAQIQEESSFFRLGLENLSPGRVEGLKAHSIGLVTNHTGRDQAGNRNVDLLLEKGLNVVAIFAPKHGFKANRSESFCAERGLDQDTELPIISWVDKVQRSKALASVDTLIFDLQDSGMRQGYVTTLLDVMKVAGRTGKKVVVLDRPNLLGSYMEGTIVNEGGEAAVAAIPVPVRHGMTVGELAHYFNKHVLDKEIALEVVPMEHYTRQAHQVATLEHRVSPNLSTTNSCYGYSFLGLLGEIAPFDIGLGTDRAFQCIMLPEELGVTKQTWYELRIVLKKFGIDSKFYRYFNERKQQQLSGLKVSIKDINAVASFSTLLAVVDFFKQADVPLSFSEKFDAAIGTCKVRAFFEGTIERQALEQEVNQELTTFFAKAMSSFMYKPLPQVVRV